jgi:hypothetical protein
VANRQIPCRGLGSTQSSRVGALPFRRQDLTKRQICVQRSEWKCRVAVPKGGRLRYGPMTVRPPLCGTIGI